MLHNLEVQRDRLFKILQKLLHGLAARMAARKLRDVGEKLTVLVSVYHRIEFGHCDCLL